MNDDDWPTSHQETLPHNDTAMILRREHVNVMGIYVGEMAAGVEVIEWQLKTHCEWCGKKCDDATLVFHYVVLSGGPLALQ